MNSCKKALYALMLVSSTCIPAKPISETAATVGAGVGGAVAGAAAGAGTYWIALKNCQNEPLRLTASGLALLGVGGLTTYFLYQWLYSMTPPGRVAAASILIANASYDSLICNEFATHEALFSHSTARFGTSWPLVIARERYTTIKHNLDTARVLLNQAIQEAQGNSKYFTLCNQCTQLSQTINQIEKTIEPRINAITKNEKYDLQTQLYEKHMEAERKRAHEQSLQFNKLYHDSSERDKDRWHDDHKDNKKYQHQNNILNQNQNRPVMLNIG